MKWFRKLKTVSDRAQSVQQLADELQAEWAQLQMAVGRLEARQADGDAWERAEFKVFSQWGEDGLIQRLVRQVPIAQRIFVEIGVENYQEANTRFLLMHDHWSGLAMDGSKKNIDAIQRDPLYWNYNLKALWAWASRGNINRLLGEQGLKGEIGLLSIDIDGNDYWLWEALTQVRPAIVIIEYNARFGPDRAVAVRYDERFERLKAHPSGIYYGASLKALHQLGTSKGYDLVGCNQAGNNAFFVRSDVRPETLPVQTPAEAYRPARFREARDQNGRLCFLSAEEEQAILANLPVLALEESVSSS
jgi:hypothetical protein